MSSFRIAVIGAGNMGANHVRVVAGHPRTALVAVIDPDPTRGRLLAESFGADWQANTTLLEKIDGVVVAAPTENHLELALPLAERGVPLLIEKPLASRVSDVRALIEAARGAGAPLMCGFVERFNPAVTTALDLIDEPILHVMSVRHSPTTPRIRTGVVSDLLIHDIDLTLRLLAGETLVNSSSNIWRAPSGVVEIADCTLGFSTGAVATLSASRMSQRKVRTLTICTEHALVEIDLLRHDVTVYRHRFHEQIDQGGPTYRAETLVDIPFVRHEGEPLALQLDHFVKLIAGHEPADAEIETLMAPHEIAAGVAEEI